MHLNARFRSYSIFIHCIFPCSRSSIAFLPLHLLLRDGVPARNAVSCLHFFCCGRCGQLFSLLVVTKTAFSSSVAWRQFSIFIRMPTQRVLVPLSGNCSQNVCNCKGYKFTLRNLLHCACDNTSIHSALQSFFGRILFWLKRWCFNCCSDGC